MDDELTRVILLSFLQMLSFVLLTGERNFSAEGSSRAINPLDWLKMMKKSLLRDS